MSATVVPVRAIDKVPYDIWRDLFNRIAQDVPTLITSGKRSYPPWQLTQVSKKWKDIALDIPKIWDHLYFEFDDYMMTSEKPLEYVLTRARKEPLDGTRSNISVEIMSDEEYPLSMMEKSLCDWIRRNPAALKALCVHGSGAALTLSRLAYASPATKLEKLRVRLPRTNSFPMPEEDYAFMPFLMKSPTVVNKLEFVTDCTFNGLDSTSGEGLSLSSIPTFKPLADVHETLLSQTQVLILVNSPHILQYATHAHLTTLDYTCGVSILGQGALLDALVGVIRSSAGTLVNLALRGWIPWGAADLLNSVREARNVRFFTIEFHLTFEMVAGSWRSAATIKYVEEVNAFLQIGHELPSLKRLQAVGSVFCQPWLFNVVDAQRVLLVMKPLQRTIDNCPVKAHMTLTFCSAQTFNGFRG